MFSGPKDSSKYLIVQFVKQSTQGQHCHIFIQGGECITSYLPKFCLISNFHIFLRHVGAVLRKIEGKVKLGSYLLYFLYLKTLKTSQNNFYMGNNFHVSQQNNEKRQKKTGRLVCYTSKFNKITTMGIFLHQMKKSELFHLCNLVDHIHVNLVKLLPHFAQ